jgi:hypothetical protein
MTRQEHLAFCSVCTNRSFDPKQGIVCGLTKEVANFDPTCVDYKEDPSEMRIENEKVAEKQTEKKKTINKARIALFIIGGLYVLVGFQEAYVLPGHELLFGIIDWIVAGIFIGLGVWSYKAPVPSLITGLVVYVAIMLLLAAIDVSTLFRGVIWKVAIIYYLIHGIKTAREEAKLVKKSNADLLDEF